MEESFKTKHNKIKQEKGKESTQTFFPLLAF